MNDQRLYGLDTQEEMPAQFLTDHAAWDRYLGHIWYNVLDFLNFAPDSRVVEIAPGSSLKLASALARLDFAGELTMVEASAEALAALKPKCAALLPRAKLLYLCGTLREQMPNLPDTPDFLLGNHILDDMILSAAGPPGDEAGGFAWAAAYTHEPAEAFRQRWQLLLKDPERLARARQAVADEVAAALEKTRPACAALNQYPSSTLYDNGLGAINDNSTAVFDLLRARYKDGLALDAMVQALLGANRHFGNVHIGAHVLNARYWMLWRQKKK